MTTEMRRTSVDVPGEWLSAWDVAIREALVATEIREREGGRGVEHSARGDLSIMVIPDTHQTGADGRDWSGAGGLPPVHVVTYDDYLGTTGGDIERALRAAVQALADMPSGMGGWRHGKVRVRVRTYGGRVAPDGPRHRAVIAHDWVVAEVRGRGVTYHDAPEAA